MYQDNLFAIDLSKNTHQGALFSKSHQILFNREFSTKRLIDWVSRQQPLMVAMEACSMANHWARVFERMGHQVRLVPTRTAARYRQGQKTNGTDAEAIGVAARQPTTKFVSPKSINLQEIQALLRIREHLKDQRLATSNMIRSLLAEFGLLIPKGWKALRERVPELLEDAANDLPMELRFHLRDQLNDYLELERRFAAVDRACTQRVNQHEACAQLLQLEGIGSVNAAGLLLALGERGDSFRNGRNASACIGATPKQHSTGDKVVIGHISKDCANKRLRANLIQGAWAVIQQLRKRDPRNAKEDWLKGVIERRGEGIAAVALVNKTIRVAWAMLHYGQDFKLHPNMA